MLELWVLNGWQSPEGRATSPWQVVVLRLGSVDLRIRAG